jgi:hypothetical protein
MDRIELEQQSLIDLKKLGKRLGVKYYYIMPKEQLIRLLLLPDVPVELKMQKMTIHQLREEAKKKGMRGFWGLSRQQLMGLLYPEYSDGKRPANQYEEDKSDTHKHNEPEQHEANEVGIQ